VLGILGGSSIHQAEAESTQPRFAVLVFSKTSAFRHDSIPQGIAAIEALGADHGFSVDSTEDATRFTDTELARYKVVVFLSTTGDILDPGQKAVFERYIRSGGGYVGIHSASDTEYQWAWYGRLVGAYFASHPVIQRATVRIEDPSHPSTKGLPAAWERTDEWYNFRSNPRGAAHILATVDETTYSGGKMGADHPIAWCQQIDGGRGWYTAMGHTSESYAEPLFRLHLLGGIESAAGVAADCAR
jgi:cytochrome c